LIISFLPVIIAGDEEDFSLDEDSDGAVSILVDIVAHEVHGASEKLESARKEEFASYILLASNLEHDDFFLEEEDDEEEDEEEDEDFEADAQTTAVLCSLIPGKIEQAQLNLVFVKEEVSSSSSSSSPQRRPPFCSSFR
jgi:hypothetical protein